MSGSSFFSLLKVRVLLCSRRSLLYLIEPLVAFFAASSLAILLQPYPSEPSLRLMQLHGQDVLSVLQQEGSFETLYLWFLGNEGQDPEAEIGKLVRALNRDYGWQVEISDGVTSKSLGAGPEGASVSVHRNFVRDGRFFTIRLNIYFRHP